MAISLFSLPSGYWELGDCLYAHCVYALGAVETNRSIDRMAKIQAGASVAATNAAKAADAADANTARTTEVAASSSRQRPQRLRWLLAAGALVAAVSTTWAVLAYEERPLANAAREFQSGKPARALAWANYYLEGRPDDSRAQMWKARALVELNRPVEALAIFERANAATFDEVHAWAKAYLLNQQWTRALPILTWAATLRPDDADVLHELSTCRIRMGLLEEATEAATRLTRLPGQEARGWLLQATIHNDVGDHRKTIECYGKVLAMSPDATGLQLAPHEVFLQFGLALLNAGQPAEGQVLLRRSLALLPTTDAAAALGNALSLAGDSEGAKAAWRRAVELSPGNLSAREALAKAALQDRDFAAGKKWLMVNGQVTARSSSAYLMHRLLTLEGDQAAADVWAKRAEEYRQRELRMTRMDELLLRSPRNYWSNVIRAYRFAQAGNWPQAADMLEALTADGTPDPFIGKLAEAVRVRGPLPSLDEVPASRF
jgi:tetratricopeptide (TPR) repeat protein